MERNHFSRTDRLAQEKSDRSNTTRQWLATITQSLVRLSIVVKNIFPDGFF